MRTVALDVHKRFAEVAVHEDGGVRRLGRIETGQLREFAASLGPTDHVVLESTAMTWAIAELLSEHAGRRLHRLTLDVAPRPDARGQRTARRIRDEYTT